MDRQERDPDEEEIFRRVFSAMQTRLWTAMPAIVQSVNLTAMTVDAKPSIIGEAPNADGTTRPWPIPVCPDCPIVFPGGGGAFMEFPIVPGDEVLLVFCSRSLDLWFQSGGVQRQSEPGRMHNLSDAVAIPCLRSKPRAKTLDATVVRIRNDTNTSYIEYNPVAGSIHMVAPGGVNINGAIISATGEVTDALGKVLGTHTHNETGSVTLGPN